MASQEEHLEQFERNLATVRTLVRASDYDWAVIVQFYAALHVVQAWFAGSGVIPANHRQRDLAMLASADLKTVLEPYRSLRAHSENARYLCQRYSRDDFEAIETSAFNLVISHMRSLLGGRL